MLVLMLNSGMRFVLPLLAPLLLDHGLSMSALGALFSGGNIAAGIAGTLAGGLLMKYLSPGRALFAAYGVQGIALLAVVMTLLIAPGPLLLPILQGLIVVQSVSLACALVCLYATLMALSSPLQAGVDFTLFQCTDAAIAILVRRSRRRCRAALWLCGLLPVCRRIHVAGGVDCFYPTAFGKRTNDKLN